MRHTWRTCCEPRQHTEPVACDTSVTAGARVIAAIEAYTAGPARSHLTPTSNMRLHNLHKHRGDQRTLNGPERPRHRSTAPRGVAALVRLAAQEFCKCLGERGANTDKELRALVNQSGLIWPSIDWQECRSGQRMVDSASAGRVRQMPRASTWKHRTIGRPTPTWMATCCTWHLPPMVG